MSLLPRSDDAPAVLIVDDVPDNLALLCDALGEAGYAVLVATDGRSAIERLRHVTPDAILLDAVMPGVDGFETCRLIKAEPVWNGVPIIFMTGLTEAEHVVKAFTAGGIDYITKPIRPDEVLVRLAAHRKTARTLRQALEERRPEMSADTLKIRCGLTQREAEILLWVAKGKTNRDIGDILGTSPRTVSKHLEHIYRKLGVETRAAAAGIAIGGSSSRRETD